MKRLFVVWGILLVLPPLSVSAQYVDRYIDFLEPGNPGGWETSLKTWDVEYSMQVGDIVAFDVWLGDVGGKGLLEASFFATYDPSKLSMFGVEAYDGSNLPGPWNPEMTNIFPPDVISPGRYWVDCFNMDCVQPDSDGQTIVARGQLQSKTCGDAIITLSDLPVF